MNRTSESGEEGQIVLALLLAVVAVLFLGLVYAQVGSAAEQKTQTQTAADSAAVAAAHLVRDYAITQAPLGLEWSFRPQFTAAIASGVYPEVQAAACGAAQRNWDGNPHGGTSLDCGAGLVAAWGADQVRVDLLAPPGQVVDGPADVAGVRERASAVARVAQAHCPAGSAVPSMVARWILDRTMQTLGRAGGCFTPADQAALDELDEASLGTVMAAVGPPGPILDEVRSSVRVELVD